MTVCAAEKRDLVQCLNIYNYYIENSCWTFEEAPLTESLFETRAANITEQYPFFVVRESGRVLGYGYLDKFSDRSAYRYTADLSLYVDRAHVGEGIGRMLFCELEREAARSGIRNIISIVTSSNAASIRFHEKNGFRLMGELEHVGCKFGRWHSVRYYQKSPEGVFTAI